MILYCQIDWSTARFDQTTLQSTANFKHARSKKASSRRFLLPWRPAVERCNFQNISETAADGNFLMVFFRLFMYEFLRYRHDISFVALLYTYLLVSWQHDINLPLRERLTPISHKPQNPNQPRHEICSLLLLGSVIQFHHSLSFVMKYGEITPGNNQT